VQDNDDGSPTAADDGEKRPWRRPSLERVGELREIILGGGKVGSNMDMDPQVANKPGAG